MVSMRTMRTLRVRWLVPLATLLLGAGAVGAAAEWPLGGTLELRGATIVDPPPGERGDTHASFVVEGEPARRLYEALRVPEIEDLCEGEGGRLKRVGNLACTRNADASRHECDFAIDLTRGTLELGRVC